MVPAPTHTLNPNWIFGIHGLLIGGSGILRLAYKNRISLRLHFIKNQYAVFYAQAMAGFSEC